MVEVLVLDHHRMVAQAIGGVLSEVAGSQLLGICSTTAEACDLILRRTPRVLVLDVELGGENYLDVADLLRQLNPRAEFLFITVQAAQFQPSSDLAPNTIAVVDKSQAWSELLEILRGWW